MGEEINGEERESRKERKIGRGDGGEWENRLRGEGRVEKRGRLEGETGGMGEEINGEEREG